MTIKRLGFCCKWIDRADQVDGIKPKDDCKKYNTGSTTVAWLNRQTKDRAVEKLWDLMKQNIEATRLLVERIGNLDAHLRMVRLSSDILPVYTEPTWSWFWRQPDVVAYAERHFGQIGSIARSRSVRLSFHPGQFTVLASDNDDIVSRSIEEFEYHVDMARWMGFGKTFQDYKINVHISGRRGPEGVRLALKRLSDEARRCITIENEEISYGLNDCLQLGDVVPIVLDIHHHYIREGEYILCTNDLIKRVVDSWRGIRPVFHYSQCREDYLDPKVHTGMTAITDLFEQGYKKQKLRAHSDFMWNQKINEWAQSHWEWGDCMVEAKAKNLASFELAKFWKSREE